MKKRVLITTLVSFLLLCAVVAAGLNAVFTVTSVQAEFSVASAEGEREASKLKQELDGYVGKSSTFLDEEEIASVIAAYPCMKAEKIEKHYPSTLEVRVSERREAFSLLTEQGYAVLSDDGTYLYNKTDLSNRRGGENILLSGFSFELVQGQAVNDGAFSAVIALYRVFSDVLGEPRANLVSLTYNAGVVFDTFVLQMKEGIRIEIVSPTELTAEKARAALCDEKYGYLARSDGEKLSGCITVIASEEKIEVDYDFARN